VHTLRSRTFAAEKVTLRLEIGASRFLGNFGVTLGGDFSKHIKVKECVSEIKNSKTEEGERNKRFVKMNLLNNRSTIARARLR